MNPREVLELLEPLLAGARDKLVPLLSLPFAGARDTHDKAGPITRVASGLAAGMLAGRLLSSLGR